MRGEEHSLTVGDLLDFISANPQLDLNTGIMIVSEKAREWSDGDDAMPPYGFEVSQPHIHGKRKLVLFVDAYLEEDEPPREREEEKDE